MAMQLRKISLATGGTEAINNISEENLDAVIKSVVVRSVTNTHCSTGIPAILFAHSAGPLWCTLVPFASTATVTGMSFTSNS